MIDRKWASLAINVCVSEGVDHFFLAPGSRCTPLTLAVAHHSNAHVVQHFDERALAFAALGYGRATGKPGVFICTSGTAVANAFPAVIEASMERVPLLLMTGDRPPELRGTGANQTIDQQRIFGEYVRWFFDMPVPTQDLGFDFLRLQLDRALSESNAGPVHLNWMFREPFGLGEAPVSAFQEESKAKVLAKVESSPYPIDIHGDTLLIAGGCRPDEAAAIKKLADRIGAPLLTDITSGLRGISPDVGATFNLPEPDTVVHLGGRIVSKQWLNYTSSLKQTRFLHVTPQDVQINPNQLPLQRHVASLESVRFRSVTDSSPSFRDAWLHAEASRRETVAQLVAQDDVPLNEPRLAWELGRMLSDGHGLFLGNSMPIRDFDLFAFWEDEKNIVVAANRGASGIDGLIATGVGFAMGTKRPTTVVLGDLSALHDLNSLALVSKSDVPMTVVVVNNQAGGIFDMLPVSDYPKHFEQYFATPHSFRFEHAAAMFGVPYQHVSNASDFIHAYQSASQSGDSTLIEVRTDRATNQLVRKKIRIGK